MSSVQMKHNRIIDILCQELIEQSRTQTAVVKDGNVKPSRFDNGTRWFPPVNNTTPGSYGLHRIVNDNVPALSDLCAV